MKKLAFILLEIGSLPALALLFSISIIGRGAHALGRFVTDTLDEIEEQIGA